MPDNLIYLFNLNNCFRTSKKASCNCAQNEFVSATKAEATFNFSNGKTIALCGYKDTDIKPSGDSEFVLSVCGQDTIIGFWGAVQTCRVKMNKDIVLVQELKNLTVGKNFAYQPTVWTTEKIYFNGEELVRKLEVNKKIKKYNQAEIKAVLKAFETAKPKIDDNKMTIADKLFIAAISGSEKARKYFNEFPNKFELDGTYGEIYSELTEMLELWDNQ